MSVLASFCVYCVHIICKYNIFPDNLHLFNVSIFHFVCLHIYLFILVSLSMFIINFTDNFSQNEIKKY